jgi:hypothetical protein
MQQIYSSSRGAHQNHVWHVEQPVLKEGTYSGLLYKTPVAKQAKASNFDIISLNLTEHLAV